MRSYLSYSPMVYGDQPPPHRCCGVSRPCAARSSGAARSHPRRAARGRVSSRSPIQAGLPVHAGLIPNTCVFRLRDSLFAFAWFAAALCGLLAAPRCPLSMLRGLLATSAWPPSSLAARWGWSGPWALPVPSARVLATGPKRLTSPDSDRLRNAPFVTWCATRVPVGSRVVAARS